MGCPTAPAGQVSVKVGTPMLCEYYYTSTVFFYRFFFFFFLFLLPSLFGVDLGICALDVFMQKQETGESPSVYARATPRRLLFVFLPYGPQW